MSAMKPMSSAIAASSTQAASSAEEPVPHATGASPVESPGGVPVVSTLPSSPAVPLLGGGVVLAAVVAGSPESLASVSAASPVALSPRLQASRNPVATMNDPSLLIPMSTAFSLA